MASTSDVIMAVAVVAGLGLLIYAGEKLAQWGAGLEKDIASWESGMQLAGGLIPWAAESTAATAGKAISGMNYTLWGIPPTESQFDWAKQQIANWGTGIEKDVGNWWAGVEKRLEKGLTTWW